MGSRGWALADPEHPTGRVIARSRVGYVGHRGEHEAVRRLVAAAADGRPGVLVVTGETGSGKSRLLEEAEREARTRGMRTRTLNCYPGWTDDFAPLQSLADGRIGDARIGADTLAGQAIDRAHQLISAARDEPLAVVLDDVDVADPGTLQVLRYLLRWCEQHAMSGGVSLLIACAMVDLTQVEPEVGTVPGDEPVLVVRLGPLSQLESVELVKELALGDVSRVVAEAIAERCEGNPLVARVITDVLLAESRVGPGALDNQLVGADTLLWRLPRSPDAAVESQVESLDRDARRVLALAATLDGHGPVSWVAVLAGEPDADVGTRLDVIEAAGLATVDDTVTFTHPLCRERALSELSIAELETAHARICDLLIADGDDGSAVLIEHLRHAGRAVDPALVFQHAVVAGRAARDQRQWSKAIHALQLAATAARRLPETSTEDLAELWGDMGDALLAAGEVHEARLWMERSAEQFDHAGHREGWASSTIAGLRSAVWAGAFGDHLDLEPLRTIASDESLPAQLRGEAKLVASELAWMTGDVDESLRWSTGAYESARALASASLCAEALVSRATGRWLQLDLVRAAADLDEAARWADDTPTAAGVALVEGRRALTAWWLGRPAEAQAAAARGLAAAAAGGTRLERALPLAARAAVAALAGEHRSVLEATDEAELIGHVSGDEWAAAFTFPTAAASAAWQGDFDGARAQLDRWRKTLDGVGAESRHTARFMVDTTRRFISVLAGDREQRSWFETLSPPELDDTSEHANVGTATFFTMLVESAAVLDLPDLARVALPYIDDAQERGQVVTSGWPALLARVGATAARASGDPVGAFERAGTALALADERQMVVEQIRSHLELAHAAGAADPIDGLERGRAHRAWADELNRICRLTFPDMG